MKVANILKKYTMTFALVVVFVFFTFLTGGRLIYAQNISNLLLQNAYVLVMACGMLLCILTGGNVDLSVGSTLCLSAALSAKLMQGGANAGVAILSSLAVAAVIGLFQGYLIGYVHIPPFICTLAGMFLWRGVGRVILDSKTISIQNDTFLNLFSSYIQIPGLDSEKHYISALIVGIVVAVIATAMMLR
ncbi:MAG: sugar ABC transporter permease, partial [Lachnospiraceae bacterium]